MDTTEIKADTTALKQDTEQMLADIARLQAQLPQVEQRAGSRGFMLQRYLDELTSCAETLIDGTIDSSDRFADEEQGDGSDVASNRDSETEASKELKDVSRNLQSGGGSGVLQNTAFSTQPLELDSNSPQHVSDVEFNAEKSQYPYQLRRDLPRSETAIPLHLPPREDGADRCHRCHGKLEDGVCPLCGVSRAARKVMDLFRRRGKYQTDSSPPQTYNSSQLNGFKSVDKPRTAPSFSQIYTSSQVNPFESVDNPPATPSPSRIYTSSQVNPFESVDKPPAAPSPSRIYTSSQLNRFETLPLRRYHSGSADANASQPRSAVLQPQQHRRTQSQSSKENRMKKKIFIRKTNTPVKLSIPGDGHLFL